MDICAGFVLTSPMLRTLFNFPGEGVSPLRRRSRSLILASLLLPLPKMLTDAPMPACCSDNSMGAGCGCVGGYRQSVSLRKGDMKSLKIDLARSMAHTWQHTSNSRKEELSTEIPERSRPRLGCASSDLRRFKQSYHYGHFGS